MAIQIADQFSYSGVKPLDARLQFSSVANMKAATEASLYDGCFAYVTATKKYYTYDSTNTVDSTTGKWREFSSGGGGGTSDYTDLTNKPRIAGVELSGNKLLNQFGLTDQVETQSTLSIDRNTKSYVNRGEKYDWNTASTWYGTCTTSASTTAKSVTLDRGTLNFTAGAKIAVKFSYNNTASAPTLTIDSTTKNIKYIDADGNVSTPLIWWNAGDVVEFVYDGTQWLMQPTMQMLFSGQGTKIPRESIYSTTEKVVGCWTDGRPVYQKTFNYTMPTVSTDGTRTVGSFVAIGASVGTVVDIQATLYSASASTYDVVNYVDKLSEATNTYRKYTRFFVVNNSASSNKNTLCALCNDASFSGATAYVTLQYTKTTDAANSFKYGDPNEYSTTEKIVGTWIDGKTLYQKTISCGALPNASAKQVSHGIGGNTFRVIEIQGRADNINSGIFGMAIQFAGNTTDRNTVECWVNSTSVYIATKMDLSAYGNCYVTLKYTK